MKKFNRMCPFCKRPMILFGPRKGDRGGIRPSELKNGPRGYRRDRVYPKWCGGHCEGISAEVWILTTELLDHVRPSQKRRMEKWAKKLRGEIDQGIVDLVRGFGR